MKSAICPAVHAAACLSPPARVISSQPASGAPPSLAQLDNSVLDAKAMAELLASHGYDVSTQYDLNRDDFDRALSNFGDK